MEALISILESWGYLGMFIAAVLAGSIIPFSSEIVLIALLIAKLDLWPLVLVATAGTTIGACIDYSIGRMEKQEWFQKYLHVKPEKIEHAKKIAQGKGAWFGIFSALPFLGNPIAIVLGLMRVNPYLFVLSALIGKFIRYMIVLCVLGFLF